ncbi:MAG TPA: hypothetical protein VNL38_02540 [Candidatus Nitrosotenuis sp.]|nr:hypothetical protein [Candidatus Nitrosotenuis sp.]
MKSFVIALLVSSLSAVPVGAASPFTSVVEGERVRYIGGSIPNLKANTVGRLDTTNILALKFESADGEVEIPYKLIRAFQYERRLARHLGVALTVAVALVKHRQRRHIIRISYFDAQGTPQAGVFEVSKDNAIAVVAVLQARAPKPCPRNERILPEGRTEEGQACRIPPQWAFSPTP